MMNNTFELLTRVRQAFEVCPRPTEWVVSGDTIVLAGSRRGPDTGFATFHPPLHRYRGTDTNAHRFVSPAFGFRPHTHESSHYFAPHVYLGEPPFGFLPPPPCPRPRRHASGGHDGLAARAASAFRARAARGTASGGGGGWRRRRRRKNAFYLSALAEVVLASVDEGSDFVEAETHKRLEQALRRFLRVF